MQWLCITLKKMILNLLLCLCAFYRETDVELAAGKLRCNWKLFSQNDSGENKVGLWTRVLRWPINSEMFDMGGSWAIVRLLMWHLEDTSFESLLLRLPLQVAILSLIPENIQDMQPMGQVFLCADIVTNLNTLLTAREKFEYFTEVSYKQLLSWNLRFGTCEKAFCPAPQCWQLSKEL